MNYTPDPQTELLPEEYVDVYGIPFSVIPYKGKPSGHRRTGPSTTSMPCRSGSL